MKWIKPSLIIACILFVVFTHFFLPASNVFDPWGVKLNTVDAYWQVRYADLSPDFPVRDYYLNFPEGNRQPFTIAYPFIIRSVADGLNISTKMAAAWIPPFLFLLSLIPFYLFVRKIFNSKVALIAFTVYCLIPGQLLNRTMLGGADYHALEILLLTTILYFVACTIKESRFDAKILSAWIAVGVFMIYLLSWQGAPLIAFILGLYVIALVAAAYKKVWKVVESPYGPVLVLLVGCAALIPFLAIENLAGKAWQYFTGMFIVQPAELINEASSLIFTNGRFDISIIWNEYGIAFFIALIGLGLLIYEYWKRRDKAVLFFLVVTFVLLGITFAQRRFTYYLSLEIAALTGYAVYYFWQQVFHKKANRIKFAVAMALIIAIPLSRGSIVQAQTTEGYMSTDWTQAVNYMRGIATQQEKDRFTYEIAGNKVFSFISRIEQPDRYYTGQKPPFGVLTWWDAGYWIVAESHMPVMCSPGAGDRVTAAKILLSNGDVRRELGTYGLKYIVVSWDMLTKQAYSMFVTSGYTGELKHTLMYRLFYDVEVPGIRKIIETSNHEVMIFEVR